MDMDRNRMKHMGLSRTFSQCSAVLSLATLLIYSIYGLIYSYFDLGVFLSLALGVICAQVYVIVQRGWSCLLNLVSVAFLSFGVGLFFLNSYPVWADRLNNIDMYGSRGTLVPVVSIILLLFVCILLGIISCFSLDRKDVKK